MRDMINSHNGFLEIDMSNNNNISENYTSKIDGINKPITITQIDSNIFSKKSNIKNKYDWSKFCKIDKKSEQNDKPMPKLGEYNLKDPSLRLKGVKNKKSNNNILLDAKK